MAAAEIETLARLLARLPGMGPRSSKRAVLALLKRPDSLAQPIQRALADCLARVHPCATCGNLDVRDPCAICADPTRDRRTLLVLQDVEDIWAMERGGSHRGLYHVLGGTLSASSGVGPEDLGIDRLMRRVLEEDSTEIILALPATVDGQTTAHYLAERLRRLERRVTRLGHGVPVGGELTFLDEGTLAAAMRSRQPMD